jgi:hypothetical protein
MICNRCGKIVHGRGRHHKAKFHTFKFKSPRKKFRADGNLVFSDSTFSRLCSAFRGFWRTKPAAQN